MIPSQLRVLRRIIPNGEIIEISETVSQLRTKLPELIHRDPRVVKYCRLPRSFDYSVVITWRVRAAVFFEHDRLVVGFADNVVLFDPLRTP